MKLRILIFLLVYFAISSLAYGETYTKIIEKEKLVLRAPTINYSENGLKAFSNSKKLKQVRINYGKQSFTANKVSMRNNIVRLQNSFTAKFERSSLEGKALAYNFNTNYFDAEQVTLNSDLFTIGAQKLSYYGETIDVQGLKFGLTLVNIGIGIEGITLYPGWGVLRNTSFETLDRTFYTIPVWVIDTRRNAFTMPPPLPTLGSSKYRGTYGVLNTHYFLNEKLYGFAHLGDSETKGLMGGFGQIIRYSDQDQFYAGGDWWAFAEPQTRLEYNHSFLQLPYRKPRMNFEEMLDYNRRVKDLNSSDLNIVFTKREEINDEEVDRDIETKYAGHFMLRPELGLDLSVAHGHVYEYFTNLHAIRSESVFRLLYFKPLWVFDPLWWGLDYQRSDYDLKPFTWQRVDGNIEWGKEFGMFLFGLKFTHYFYNAGGSPFIFDTKYTVPNDNMLYTFRFGKRLYNLGIKFLQDTELNLLVDTTYFLTWSFSGWGLQANYSTLREAFSLNIALEVF